MVMAPVAPGIARRGFGGNAQRGVAPLYAKQAW